MTKRRRECHFCYLNVNNVKNAKSFELLRRVKKTIKQKLLVVNKFGSNVKFKASWRLSFAKENLNYMSYSKKRKSNKDRVRR